MDKDEEAYIMKVQSMVKKAFGRKLSLWSYRAENSRYKGILYGAFLLTANFDRYESIGFAIDVGGLPVTSFFGHSGLVFATPEGISEAHRYIDDYCRAILPDKFIERFEQALG